MSKNQPPGSIYCPLTPYENIIMVLVWKRNLSCKVLPINLNRLTFRGSNKRGVHEEKKLIVILFSIMTFLEMMALDDG